MNLTPPLSHLEATRLIRRLNDARVTAGELEYLINHALVQDTAYASLLKHERKRLHRLIGETIEHVYPDALSENAALLAKHYTEAGDDAKILEYGLAAGDSEARVFAKPEAIEHYRAALDAALRLGAERDTIIGLVTKLGRMYELQDANTRALETYARLVELGRARHEPAYELAGLMLQATLRATPTSVFDPHIGQQLLDRALELASELNDGAAQAKILWNLLLLNGFTGRYHAAVEYGEQSLALARDLGLETQIAYTLNDIGNYGYFASGHPEKSREAMREARALWRQLDILPMLGDNLNNSGILEYMRGDYAQAQQFVDEALAVSERTENAWGMGLAHTMRGCLAYEGGDYGKALQELQPALELARLTGSGIQLITGTNLALLYAELGEIEAGYEAIQVAQGEVGIALYRASSKAALAYLTFLRGEVERAYELLKEARPRTRDELQFSYLPSIIVEGEMGLAAECTADVISYMQPIIESLSAYGFGSFVADAELYLGRAFLVLGDIAAARQAYERGAARAAQVGSRRALSQIYAHWASLERAAQNQDRADDLQTQADRLVESIAATLPEPYRTGFLDRNRSIK